MKIPHWFSEIRFAFSIKSDGQMSFKRGKRETVYQNRAQFLAINSLNINNLVSAGLVHGNKISIVGKADIRRNSQSTALIPDVDGFVTTESGILLSTTHADCLPVVLYDSRRKVIGQAHCGWRGLHAGIIQELIRTFRKHGNSDPKDVQAWVGPGICAKCYIVKSDVADKFPSEFTKMVAAKLHLELNGFARSELINHGITINNVTMSNICTSCQPEYSSFRRDGDGFNAMLLVTGL